MSNRLSLGYVSAGFLMPVLLLASGTSYAAVAPVGRIERMSEKETREFKQAMTASEWCSPLSDRGAVAACFAADRALRMFFGQLYDGRMPVIIGYLAQDTGADLRSHVNLRLIGPIADGRVTPHLTGAQQVYLLVVAERSDVRLQGFHTTLNAKSVNPFTLLPGVPAVASGECAGEAEIGASRTLALRELSADGNKTRLWYSLASFVVHTPSVNRITVLTVPQSVQEAMTASRKSSETIKVAERPTAVSASTAAFDDAAQGDAAKAVTLETTRTRTLVQDVDAGADSFVAMRFGSHASAEGEQESAPLLDTLSATSNFSVSDGTRTALSLTLGWTLNAGHFDASTQVRTGSEVGINVFAMGKFYVRRPQVKLGASAAGFKRSWAIAVGTNITPGSLFDQLFTGVVLGHLVDRLGIIVGFNWITPVKGGIGSRQRHLMAGIDYTF